MELTKRKLILAIPIIVLIGWLIFYLSSGTQNKVQDSPIQNKNVAVPQEVVVSTDKSEYSVGDTVTILIENNLNKPIWHDNSCSIGPCSYFNGELNCIRLDGITCTQSKLDAGDKITLQYPRPV